jgi:hypothetical protein
VSDSARWCATCQAHGDHHTDRHPKTLHDGDHDDHIKHPHHGDRCMVEGNDWDGTLTPEQEAFDAQVQANDARLMRALGLEPRL